MGMKDGEGKLRQESGRVLRIAGQVVTMVDPNHWGATPGVPDLFHVGSPLVNLSTPAGIIPTVVFLLGWIEFKVLQHRYLTQAALRGDAPFKLDHYTVQQRVWHRNNAVAGARVHLMLRHDTEGGESHYYLFHAEEAARRLGTPNGWLLQELSEHCLLFDTDRGYKKARMPTPEHFCRALLKD